MLSSVLVSILALAPPAEALPEWAQAQWAKAGIGNTFSRSTYAKPGLLRADFNGDGKPDVAVLVTRKGTGSRGIVVLHQGLTQYHVLGAGPETGSSILHGNFEWVDHWTLYTKPTTHENLFAPSGDLSGSRQVRLQRPAIEISAEEQGGGMIYWNGKVYIWLHQTC